MQKQSSRFNPITFSLCVLLTAALCLSCIASPVYAEDSAETGLLGTRGVQYNGQLHVDGTKLANERGEAIQLKGMNNGGIYATVSDSPFSEVFRSATSVSGWGANALRIPVLPTYWEDQTHGYVFEKDAEKVLNNVYAAIDDCIANDMYAIVNWHTLHDRNPNIHIDRAIDFFTKVSAKYKNCPNVLYELTNEPKDLTWAELKQYSETLIPVIRTNSPNAVIITGFGYMTEEIANNLINDDNLMYIFHIYLDVAGDLINQYRTYEARGIPLFVTEWGPYVGRGDDREYLNREITLDWLRLLASRGTSWCMWVFQGNMVDGEWDSALGDSQLTNFGQFVKSLYTMDLSYPPAVSMAKNSSYAFWADAYRQKITSVTVLDTIPQEAVSQAAASWDISQNSDNSVIAYVEAGAGGNYSLYIAGEGGVYGPANMNAYFFDFPLLQSADVKHFHTDNVNNMSSVFRSNPKLISLDLGSWDVSKVSTLWKAFSGCSSLENLNLSNWNTVSLTNMDYTFESVATTGKMQCLDVSSFDTSNVTGMTLAFGWGRIKNILFGENFKTAKVKDMTAMFARYQGTSLDLSSFDTSNVRNMYQMFFGCDKLQTLDLTMFDTSSVTNMYQMFNWTSCLYQLDLSSFDVTKTAPSDGMFSGMGSYYASKDIIIYSSSTAKPFFDERVAGSTTRATVSAKN